MRWHDNIPTARTFWRSLSVIVVAGAVVLGSAEIASTGAAATQHANQDYPPEIYPAPTKHPAWGLSSSCANPAGTNQLEPSAADSSEAAIKDLTGHARHDRRYTDRAYWPELAHETAPVYVPHAGMVMTAKPAKSSAYAGLVRNNCGAEIVDRSEQVEVLPSASSPKRRTNALTVYYWLLERRGHWLVWFSYP
jgi:hypothetical protein